MKLSGIFAIASHIANLVIIIYFISFLIKIESTTTFDIFVSFFGLFVSLLANILSALEQ